MSGDNGGPILKVDVTEPDPDFRVMMLRGQGIPAEKRQLKTADYAWDTPAGEALTERKKAEDLLSSLYDGRLDDQMQRMVEEAFWPFLLIEGRIDEYQGHIQLERGNPMNAKQIDYDRLDNALVAWQARGVIIKHSPNAATTHIRIASLYRWTQLANPDYVPIMARRKRLPNLGRLSVRAEVLAGLPQIGANRAEKLAALAPLREILGSWKAEDFAAALGGQRKLGDQLVTLLEEAP